MRRACGTRARALARSLSSWYFSLLFLFLIFFFCLNTGVTYNVSSDSTSSTFRRQRTTVPDRFSIGLSLLAVAQKTQPSVRRLNIDVRTTAKVHRWQKWKLRACKIKLPEYARLDLAEPCQRAEVPYERERPVACEVDARLLLPDWGWFIPFVTVSTCTGKNRKAYPEQSQAAYTLARFGKRRSFGKIVNGSRPSNENFLNAFAVEDEAGCLRYSCLGPRSKGGVDDHYELIALTCCRESSGN